MPKFPINFNRDKIFISLAVGGGILAALIFFFPLDPIKDRILSDISAQSQVDITVKEMHIGTGLGLGLSRGSLFALRGEDAVVGFPTGQTVKCQQLIVAPSLLPLLTAQFAVSLYCKSSKIGEVTAQIKGRPFWNPVRLQVEVDLKDFKLSLIEEFTGIGPIGGEVSGSLELPEFNPRGKSLSNINWDLSAKDFSSPPVDSPIFSAPPLSVGALKSRGSFSNSHHLKILDLSLGNPQGPIEGAFQSDLKINNTRGIVMLSGQMSGKLRINPEVENTQLKDIKFDIAFGQRKASGFREFTKKLEGGVQSILFTPPMDRE